MARVELSDCDRRTRCGVFDDETGGVIEFLAIVTRFFGTSVSPFVGFSLPFFSTKLFRSAELFWLFGSLLSSDDDRCPFGVSDALFELDRKKRCAHGDRWASDSNISCFSFITIVRSGLWPRYVCIVSNVRNSHCGSWKCNENEFNVNCFYFEIQWFGIYRFRFLMINHPMVGLSYHNHSWQWATIMWWTHCW